jgi:tetratricopeptide (TPR) repeat protein
MRYKRTSRTIIIGIFTLLSLIFNGCSVFSTIGDGISQGYENTVSYFNGYYNAKRLFSEAEDEIRSDTMAARAKGKTAKATDQIPNAAKQKLVQVIDKCSNILAFHPTSSLVDDALLMIGKSFFYQAEYIKAERKFEELLVQYPKSSLTMDVQLWLARSEERLGRFEEGVRLCEAIIPAAKANDDKKVEIQAHQILALIYIRMNQNEKSVNEYEKVMALTSDKEIRRDAQIRLGDIYSSNAQYEKAIDAYLRAKKYTSDVYSNFYCGLRAAVSYRQIGDSKKALALLDAMIKDFRNKDFLPGLLLERANNYEAGGRLDEAIGEYIYIDTTYARTDNAAQSAYRLGAIYEREVGDYKRALKYYAEVNSNNTADSAAIGRIKYLALTRYFEAWRKLTLADSLIVVLKDTTRRMTIDTVADDSSDTIQKKNITVAPHSVISKDSSQTKSSSAISLPRNIDSLTIIKSVAAQELGDIFYSELLLPDSAFYWYNQSLALNYDRVHSPRILYILGEISRTYPERKYSTPEEYYKRLERDFPESVYTGEVNRLLRKTSAPIKADTATEYYKEAERHIDAKQYKKAIEKLHTIVKLFPISPFAAKSEYATGWLFENYLEQPESAKVHYKNVIKNYPNTIYAFNALRKTMDTVQADSSKKPVINPGLSKIDTMKSAGVIENKKTTDIKNVHEDTSAAKSDKLNRTRRNFREEIEKRSQHESDSTQTKQYELD